MRDFALAHLLIVTACLIWPIILGDRVLHKGVKRTTSGPTYTGSMYASQETLTYLQFEDDDNPHCLRVENRTTIKTTCKGSPTQDGKCSVSTCGENGAAGPCASQTACEAASGGTPVANGVWRDMTQHVCTESGAARTATGHKWEIQITAPTLGAAEAAITNYWVSLGLMAMHLVAVVFSMARGSKGMMTGFEPLVYQVMAYTTHTVGVLVLGLASYVHQKAVYNSGSPAADSDAFYNNCSTEDINLINFALAGAVIYIIFSFMSLVGSLSPNLKVRVTGAAPPAGAAFAGFTGLNRSKKLDGSVTKVIEQRTPHAF